MLAIPCEPVRTRRKCAIEALLDEIQPMETNRCTLTVCHNRSGWDFRDAQQAQQAVAVAGVYEDVGV